MRHALALGLVVLALTILAGDRSRRAVDVIVAHVVDAHTHDPISDAIITADARELRTDARGMCRTRRWR
jgi:hypothetical protein